MRLGVLARSDKTGLGNQTRNLTYMLQPEKVMLINSAPFNQNQQYPETYKDYNVQEVNGFPTNFEVLSFLYNLDAVLTCELFYHPQFVEFANNAGIHTYNQCNYEFLDNLVNNRMPLPTKFLMPSKWKIKEMESLFGPVEYLPPPLMTEDFFLNKETNLHRTGKLRFLHVVGRQAINDRNGTIDLLESLKYTKGDFELVLKAQTLSPLLEQYSDSRITIDLNSPLNENDLYKDFDAMILPRRYAGLCLPMNEALASGLPVIMTDISPNNEVLPKEWLVPSRLAGSFKARTNIDFYSADHKELARKLDWLCKTNLIIEKIKASNIGLNYSADVLLLKYKEIIQ